MRRINKKTNKMSRVKMYTESQFYVDGKFFMKELSKVVNNMNRDYKESYGYDLLKHSRDFIVDFSISFKDSNFETKLKCSRHSMELLNIIDIELNLLKDIHVITLKQFTFLYKYLGVLLLQLSGWCSSLENKKK